jgi:hypothetical protein
MSRNIPDHLPSSGSLDQAHTAFFETYAASFNAQHREGTFAGAMVKAGKRADHDGIVDRMLDMTKKGA